jgi:hypothetical protein
MRRTLLWLVPLVAPLCIACGSPKGGGTGAGSTTSGSTGAGGMTTGGIPSPGTSDQVDNDFTDVEPNNTPEQATPLGVAAGSDVNVWVNGNSIGGSDNPEDYFVFESSATAGAFTFDVCFMAPVTAMTATLWKVADGAEVTPPVGTWTSSAGCVTGPMAGAPLEASTVYLFGLSATGGPGMYGA